MWSATMLSGGKTRVCRGGGGGEGEWEELCCSPRSRNWLYFSIVASSRTTHRQRFEMHQEQK